MSLSRGGESRDALSVPGDGSAAEAAALQVALAERVIRRPPAGPIRLLAAVDVAYAVRAASSADPCAAAAVLWDLEAARVAARAVFRGAASFPYIPGFFGFREGPLVVECLRRLDMRPDALLCDGHGVAHPRRCGLACHVGLAQELPTVGCARRLLVGGCREPGPGVGEWSPVEHEGEVVAAALRTRRGVRPVYVSVGHLIDLPTAMDLVLVSAGAFRLPEPLRLAHRLAADSLT